MNQSKRGTGRTSRMIEWAKCLENEGRAVYIVAANYVQKDHIEKLLPKGTGIKVETPESIGGLDFFDWHNMKVRGMHPNCRVLFDHHTIERMYHPILGEWCRYD